MYIVFLIRWYVCRCFFHFFWSFLGRKPPCCVVRFVRFGMGNALHVSWIFSEIFCISRSNFVQVSFHCSSVIWLFASVFVSSLIWSEFSSKNSVLNFSIFSCGMGFRILVGLSVIVGMYRAISVFCGMCSDTGE